MNMFLRTFYEFQQLNNIIYHKEDTNELKLKLQYKL